MKFIKRFRLAIYVFFNAQRVSDSVSLASSTGYAIDVEMVSRGRTGDEQSDILITCGNGGCSYGVCYGQKVGKIAQDVNKDFLKISS